ncbi:MAG: hypothetical protein HKO13_05915 [Sphingomonas sp.]|nr:hypothetical protein [Sphingomonas sp.]RZV53094.1 MAG: hypothetical protein EX258_01035 [Sphingomonadaceae bacterium]
MKKTMIAAILASSALGLAACTSPDEETATEEEIEDTVDDTAMDEDPMDAGNDMDGEDDDRGGDDDRTIE